MESLELTPARLATFGLATSVVSDSIGDPDGLVFVTPQLNGWTVAAGAWCSPGDEDRCEQVRLLVEKLSREYGQAHAYCVSEYGDSSAWLIAQHGRTIRRYSEESPTMAIGAPLPVERRHLDALGVSSSPEQMRHNDELDEALGEFQWACNARTVAAEMSIDIVGGVWRNDSVVNGTGMMARIPGTSATSISHGAYRI